MSATKRTLTLEGAGAGDFLLRAPLLRRDMGGLRH